MKRIIYLITLLLSMIAIISLCVFLWTTKVYIAIKIIVSVLGIITSLIIFKTITNINNNYINQIDKKEDNLVPEVKEEKPKKLILCPKCYKAYDGEICFHCGYIKNVNNGHQN